jgi:selenocysteine lyase/cysteine desulfurase
MVKNTAHWLQRQYHLQIVEIPIAFPAFDGDLAYLDPLEITLQELQHNHSIGKLKVVILDHIVSIPAIKLPVRKMARLIRQYTAATTTGTTSNPNSSPFILVDGAHAWGQVPTSEISELIQETLPNNNGDVINHHQPSHVWIDAYLSNGHKWMYSPKGSAILWVHPSRITDAFPEPTVISSENSWQESSNDSQHDDPLYHRFIYTSTKDYTAMISISEAMKFRNDVLGGETEIHNYIRTLASRAKEYLMDAWNTSTPLVPNSMEEYMINVILPISKDLPNKTDVGTALQQWLYQHHNMYVVIVKEPSSGYIYTRLSAQVYLELDDFKRLGKAVLAFLEEQLMDSFSKSSSK